MRHNIIFGLFVLILILFVLSLCGCYSERKAKGQFGKAVTAYPTIAANYCSLTFPERVVTDSTAYKKSLAVIDSLANSLKQDSLISQEERERLSNEIERIRNSIIEPENCDSLSEAIYRLAAKEQRRGNILEEKNKQLIKAANSIKPIHDTVESTHLQAALASCRLEQGKIVDLLTDKTAEVKEWRKKAKNRFWVIAGMGGAIGLWLFLFIRRKIKPI